MIINHESLQSICNDRWYRCKKNGTISLSLQISLKKRIILTKDVIIVRENNTLEFKETVDTNSFLKTICAYANYSGGTIIFGICDDGTKKGIDNPVAACLNLENKINDSIKPVPNYSLEINEDQTITLKVKKGMFAPYYYKGKTYKRNDSSTIEVDRLELNRLILEGMNQTYEEQVSQSQNLLFSQLEKEMSQKIGVDKITIDILRTLGLYKNGKYNNAAALIADENQYMGVDIIRYGKNINELMEREIYDSMSIFTMYHQTLKMFRKYYLFEKIEGSQRTQKEIIPKEAFRETLANALIHRLWDINSRIRVSMFANRIEITSPGGLPSEINEKEYLEGQVSFLRNPIIGNVFFRLGYVEMFGSGIKRIKESYNGVLVKPEFEVYDNSITVILPVSNLEIELTDDEELVLDVLSLNLKMSRMQIEEKTKLNKSKIIRVLNSLSEKGVVQKSGSGPNTKYVKVIN